MFTVKTDFLRILAMLSHFVILPLSNNFLFSIITSYILNDTYINNYHENSVLSLIGVI